MDLKNLPYSKSAIFISICLCFLLIVKWSWQGIDGKGYERVIQTDGKGYYMYLPNIFLLHNLAHQKSDKRFIFEVNGRGVNKYFVGTTVALLPFFGLASVDAAITGNWEEGYAPPFQKAMSLSALFYLLFGLIFFRKLLLAYQIRDWVIALCIPMLVFGTNLLAYVVIYPSMSHLYSFTSIAAFLFLAKRWLDSRHRKYLLWMCLAFAFIVLIRPVNGIVILLLPFIAGNAENLKTSMRELAQPKNWMLCLGILAAVWSMQVMAWYVQTGKFLVWGYQNEGFNFLHPEIWKTLFGFRKGLFIYTPLILLSLSGLVLLFRQNLFKAFALSGFLAILVYAISSWWNWSYGPSFGHRAFIDFYATFGLLLALALHHFKKKIISVGLLTIAFLCLSLNMVQAYQYNFLIWSSDCMNFQKYKYTFLKTSLDYSGVLGGVRDLKPYCHSMKPVYESKIDFSGNRENWSLGNLITLKDDTVSDYSKREFNTTLMLPVNVMGEHREFFLKLQLDRYDLQAGSSSNALVVVELDSAEGGSYFYYAFKMNDYPTEKPGWKTWHYALAIPTVRSEGDLLKIYVWNRKQEEFYIDNVRVKLLAVD